MATNGHQSARKNSVTRTVCASKNLRAISLSLVAKVRSQRVVTSTDIANELVHEAVAEVLGQPATISKVELNAIQKNIRRRLYDSLKVLVSVGAITRVRRDKTLRWNGTAHLTRTDGARLSASVHAIRNRIREKHATVRFLHGQNSAMRLLYIRNARRAVDEHSRVHFPFVVVRTREQTHIALNVTDDARKMHFEFDQYFEVVNDTGIVDRLFAAQMDNYALNETVVEECGMGEDDNQQGATGIHEQKQSSGQHTASGMLAEGYPSWQRRRSYALPLAMRNESFIISNGQMAESEEGAVSKRITSTCIDAGELSNVLG